MHRITKLFIIFTLLPHLSVINSQQIVRNPVTDQEIRTLGETLWSLDTNNVGSIISINVQGATTSRSGRDNAPAPLLQVPSSVWTKPTYAALISLYDNFNPRASIPEVITPQEMSEENNFISTILSTPLMKKVEEFLLDKRFIISRKTLRDGRVVVNKDAFRDAFKQIWFTLFARENNALGSSGFEHVFLGEIKGGQTAGLHNWVYFAKQEESGALNYNGQMRVLRLGNKGMVLKENFNWLNTTKPVSTMFIGTSPEFEMGIYTLCWYARPGGQCPITLGGKSVPILTHFVTRRGVRYVSSAYPDI